MSIPWRSQIQPERKVLSLSISKSRQSLCLIFEQKLEIYELQNRKMKLINSLGVPSLKYIYTARFEPDSDLLWVVGGYSSNKQRVVGFNLRSGLETSCYVVENMMMFKGFDLVPGFHTLSFGSSRKLLFLRLSGHDNGCWLSDYTQTRMLHSPSNLNFIIHLDFILLKCFVHKGLKFFNN